MNVSLKYFISKDYLHPKIKKDLRVYTQKVNLNCVLYCQLMYI